MKYISLLFLCIIGLGYGQTSCKALKIEEYYPISISKKGTVKLFSPLNCDKAEKLNKLILTNSENILEIENDSVSGDSAKYLERKKTSDFFTKDSFDYQKVIEEHDIEFPGSINTTVFCTGDILVYTTKYDYMGDKGAPYYEFINIDLKNASLINFDVLIDKNQKVQLSKWLAVYAKTHKKQIINNYLQSLSEKADQLLGAYLDVFEQPYYNLNKLKLEINSGDFYYFSPNGIVFNVHVKDSNFLLDEERKRNEEYTSTIIIPYKSINRFLNRKSDLYAGIKKRIK